MSGQLSSDIVATLPPMYEEGRIKKAETILSVLQDHSCPLDQLRGLNIGSEYGIIDNYLSSYFKDFSGLDVTEDRVKVAIETFVKDNLTFHFADAMDMPFENNSFDVIICTQIYEHVPCAKTLFKEMFRVLKPGGIIYLSASNRLRVMEQHHRLPFLSVIPKWMAHPYMKLMKKGNFYHETHLTIWSLRKLVSPFKVHDYTAKINHDPEKYGVEYILPKDSIKQFVAKILVKWFYPIYPNYIWLLEKPKHD